MRATPGIGMDLKHHGQGCEVSYAFLAPLPGVGRLFRPLPCGCASLAAGYIPRAPAWDAWSSFTLVIVFIKWST